MLSKVIYLVGVVYSFSLFAASPELIAIPKKYEKKLIQSGNYFPDHYSSENSSVGYVDNFEALPERIQKNSIILNAQRWAVGGYDRDTFAPLEINLKSTFDGYHDYTQLTAYLKDVATQHPDFVRLETAGKSVQGRELWYVVLTKGAKEDLSKPKFIYHANMHGDEVVGRELMLYFIDYMLSQYGKNAQITQLLDNVELFVMPSMNPDGFELKTRENAHRKDINRNFPDRFTSKSDTPDGREIEVQHMMNLALKNHFVYGINWHGGEICFNLPWGNIKNKPQNMYPDDSFFNPIGREYTTLNKPMYANDHDNFDHGMTYGYEWYPVNGGINDWMNYYRRSVHSVIELTKTKWPQASTLPKHWDDNREAMLTYLWRGLRGVHLEVRDQNNNLIPEVTITVESSPKRPLVYNNGYVHRLTGDGKQKVKISATGFENASLEVDARYYDGKLDVVKLNQAAQ